MNKKITTVIFSVVSVIIIVFSSVLYKNINNVKDEILKKQEYKGIINLWHVDTFEGGIGSRSDFLRKVAIDFEKKEKGSLILVTTHTIESYLENISNGIYPDMLSFGVGIVPSNVYELSIDINFNAGNVNGKNYALPWCRGCYLIISKKGSISNSIKEATISYNGNTNPLVGINFNGINVEKFNIKSPLDAYYDFVSGNTEYLIGTQRDLHRLIKRDFDVEVKPIIEYNDLYQYISVTTIDEEKIQCSKRYIEYLLSEQVQKNLIKIGMFSEYYKLNYQDENLSKVSSVKDFNYYLPVFSEVGVKDELFNLSISGLKGDENSIKKIKNLLGRS